MILIIKNKFKYTLIFSLLIALTIGVLIINIFTGSADLNISQIISILLNNSSNETLVSVLFKIRIPRALASLILGGALALSGYLLQTFFHNPIAGPYVLGVSSGAKLTVALALVLASGRYIVLNSAVLISAAFIGSMLSLGFVTAVSHKFTHASMLVVCGIMIGYICSAITDLVVTFADDSDIVNLHSWSLGSFSGITMRNVYTMSSVVFLALGAAFILSKPISAFLLGESYAQSLGVKIKPLRAALIILSGLLSSCVTAFAGPVSFVGVAVPHLIKALFKSSKPIILIPACFLGGGIFCMACDMIARTVFAPTELSIGTVTALFGAPVVIMVMFKKRRERL